MDNSYQDKYFFSTYLIPMSKILGENKYSPITSKSFICKNKSNFNLLKLNSEQTSWIQTANRYFVLHYSQLFSSERLLSKHLFWNSYFPSSNRECTIGNRKYFSDLESFPNRATDTNDDSTVDNDHNFNNGDIINDENEDIDIGNNRDWLDNFYILSRILILFSIVYFYSSPIRFLVVTILGFSLYLYHNGLLRFVPAVRNIDNVNNDVGIVEERHEDRDPMNIVPQPLENQRLNIGVNQINFLRALRNDQRWPRILRMIWVFLSSFFISLIPDQINVP